MSRESVVHACGHEVVITLLGPMRRREIERQQLEARRCSGCRRSSHASLAAARAAEAGLPALVGTDKQVDWAIRIRDGLRKRIIARAVELEAARAATPAVHEALVDALSSVLGETDGGWWIEHRSDDVAAVLDARLIECARARGLLP